MTAVINEQFLQKCRDTLRDNVRRMHESSAEDMVGEVADQAMGLMAAVDKLTDKEKQLMFGHPAYKVMDVHFLNGVAEVEDSPLRRYLMKLPFFVSDAVALHVLKENFSSCYKALVTSHRASAMMLVF